MRKETNRKKKSSIPRKGKKRGITMDLMYSVFGLDESYLEDPNPPRLGFIKKMAIKARSIIINIIPYINSLPL